MKKENFFIIQSKKELNFFLHTKKYKNFIPIIWYPEITNLKNNKFVYISDLEKIKKKSVDIYLMKSFYNLLEKIDIQIFKYLKDVPKLNYYLNSGHSFKNLLDSYLNEVNKIKILIKRSNKIGFFYKENKNPFNFIQSIIENYDQKLKKKFVIQSFEEENSYYFFEKNSANLVTFLDHNYLSLRNIYNISTYYIKNIFNNKNNKNKILTQMFDKNDDNFFSTRNFKEYEFIKYESVYFRCKEIKINKEKKRKLFKNLQEDKKINFNFFQENRINHKNILLEIIFSNLEKVINIVIYNHKKIAYLNSIYKFKSSIHKYETLSSITVAESLADEIKSFFLSHGGTVGIFKDWPPVTSYFIPKRKKFAYLTFSKQIRNNMLSMSRKLKRKFEVDFVPNYHHLKFLNNLEFPKKISNIAYFFSPTNGVYESKTGLHHDLEIDFFRKRFLNFFKNKNNIRINCKLYNLNSIPRSLLSLLKRTKNVRIIPEKKKLSKIFNDNDLIITEVNSTTLVEAQYSNKLILSLVKQYPKILNDAKKKLLERVFLAHTEKYFFKKISELLNKKTLSKKDKRLISNRNFLKTYYSYDDLNREYIIRKLRKILF